MTKKDDWTQKSDTDSIKYWWLKLNEEEEENM